jgi:hypothetical protein
MALDLKSLLTHGLLLHVVFITVFAKQPVSQSYALLNSQNKLRIFSDNMKPKFCITPFPESCLSEPYHTTVQSVVIPFAQEK